MKNLLTLTALLIICSSVIAQTGSVPFDYPLSVGTKFTYKYYHQGGPVGSQIRTRGIHTWKVTSSNVQGDSVVFHLSSINKDTVYDNYNGKDTSWLKYSTKNFTIIVTPDNIIDGFLYSLPESIWASLWGYVRFSRHTGNDTVPGYSNCTFISGKGMDKFAINVSMHNYLIDTLMLISVEKDTSSTAVINERNTKAALFTLNQNYPNPFNPATSISYSLLKEGRINISVFDALGRRVRVLEEGVRPKGSYTLYFNASDLPGGVYFCRMVTRGYSEVKKMTLIK